MIRSCAGSSPSVTASCGSYWSYWPVTKKGLGLQGADRERRGVALAPRGHFGEEFFGAPRRSRGCSAAHRSASGACAREGSALEPILGRTSSADANVSRGCSASGARAREGRSQEPIFVGRSSAALKVCLASQHIAASRARVRARERVSGACAREGRHLNPSWVGILRRSRWSAAEWRGASHCSASGACAREGSGREPIFVGVSSGAVIVSFWLQQIAAPRARARARAPLLNPFWDGLLRPL
jgi:hypothetical protein